MSKSTFINKKVLLTMIIIIALVGIGVGAYFIFKPKPDLKAPFQNTYSLNNNETYSNVLNFNKNLIDILNTTDFSSLNDEEQESIQKSKYVYGIFSNVKSSLNSINDTLLNNLYFIEDKDNTLYKVQQSATKNYEKIIDITTKCQDYINSYLKPEILESYNSNRILWQKIDNYNNFYNDLFLTIVSFYSDIGNIFYNYTISTISANKYTKYNILTTVQWAEKTINLLLNNNSEILNSELLESSNKLNNFVNKNIVNPINEYYEDAEYYNYILDCFKFISFNDCITALSKNAFAEYLKTLDESLIQYASILKINYFFI